MKEVMVMEKLLKVLLVVVFLMTVPLVSNAISEETYPNRPITMVVWSSAGMADTLTRAISELAGAELGQPVVIETKTGAAGAIGINYVLKSKPDGYTLGMAVTSNYVVSPHMRNLKYNVLEDVTDIITICKYNFGLAVKPDAPWKTYEEVIEYARKNPGKFSYACAGVGTTQHIAMERIAKKEGIKWTQVPFKSGGEAVLAGIGGHTDAVVQGSVDLLPQFKAGKLKMLLSLDGDRWPAASDAPTITEKGYDFFAMSYISYMAPKGLPEPIMQKLHDAFKKALFDPSFVKLLAKYNVKPAYMSGKEYTKLWKSHYDAMGEVVKGLGLAKK